MRNAASICMHVPTVRSQSRVLYWVLLLLSICSVPPHTTALPPVRFKNTSLYLSLPAAKPPSRLPHLYLYIHLFCRRFFFDRSGILCPHRTQYPVCRFSVRVCVVDFSAKKNPLYAAHTTPQHKHYTARILYPYTIMDPHTHSSLGNLFSVCLLVRCSCAKVRTRRRARAPRATCAEEKGGEGDTTILQVLYSNCKRKIV